MKIKRILGKNVGPIDNLCLDFSNEWSQQIHEKVLISGSNGSGKSLILRSISAMWVLLGEWLSSEKTAKAVGGKKFLSDWDAFSIEITDLLGQDIVLFFGNEDFFNEHYSNEKYVTIGELYQKSGSPGRQKSKFLKCKDSNYIHLLKTNYLSLITSFQEVNAPNIIYLDAEERRWVAPTKNLGKVVPDNPTNRWLSKYLVNDSWDHQLESSLINLKISHYSKFLSVLEDLNSFLSGKTILPDVRTGENRLYVKINSKRIGHHLIDHLSAGEHQILIMIFSIVRWLEKGGIVIIDEPDSHLHPCLLSNLLSKIERIIQKYNAQLIITSHSPEVWNRYEVEGLRLNLDTNSDEY